jgi:ribonucleoside-triphosphate reductase
LIDGGEYRSDFGVVGVNPCAEITLESREPCNLAELFLPRIDTLEQFVDVACLLYKACKTISCFPFSDPRTEEVVSRNHRIGIGVTGYQAAAKWRGNAEAFNTVYRALEQTDVEYSRELGVATSVKLTTVKPSGTLSLLPEGCTPGLHAAYSHYMIRRIRFSADDPLVNQCRQHGYDVEPLVNGDGTFDPNVMVVSFPMKFDESVVTEEQVSAVEELEVQRFLQTYWADNSVSATHYYRLEELPEIQAWLAEHYDNSVKACSFLQANEHGFVQAPLEKIDRETYEAMKATTRPIQRMETVTLEEFGLIDSLECAGGHCPIK